MTEAEWLACADSVDDADAQDDEEAAQGRGIEGDSHVAGGPVAQDPTDQGSKARGDVKALPAGAFLGVGFLVKLAEALPQGVDLLAEEFGQEEGDGGQGTATSQDHAEAPVGQASGLRTSQVGEGLGNFVGPTAKGLTGVQ